MYFLLVFIIYLGFIGSRVITIIRPSTVYNVLLIGPLPAKTNLLPCLLLPRYLSDRQYVSSPDIITPVMPMENNINLITLEYISNHVFTVLDCFSVFSIY